jgi:hypothetical protein
MQDPFDGASLRAATSNPFGESNRKVKIGMSPDLASALQGLHSKMQQTQRVISENNEISEDTQLFTLVEDDKESNNE